MTGAKWIPLIVIQLGECGKRYRQRIVIRFGSRAPIKEFPVFDGLARGNENAF